MNWQIGDCQSLPFDDDGFDVVVSSFGVIFAPDPERAAAELSRVCRDRFALSAFAVVTEEGVWWLQGPTGEAIWSWIVHTSPPVRARLRQLSPAQGEEVRAASIRRYEHFRIEDSIHFPEMYLLCIGNKRGC